MKRTLTVIFPLVKEKPRKFNLRGLQDRIASRSFLTLTGIPVLLLIAIFTALLSRAWPIFQKQPLSQLMLGLNWHPQEGLFGFYPFITGTIWVTVVALVFAVPLCLLSAIYLSEYASPATATFMKPFLDVLAGIPSVIYGVWGVISIVPLVQKLAPLIANRLSFFPIFRLSNPTGYSILAGGIVLAVMISPIIIAVVYEVLRAIPQDLRFVSLAVGATHWQTIKHAVIPKAMPGIVAGIVLGLSRAVGETMAVLMVVGNVVQVPGSVFDAAYPLTALIANNFGEMLSIPMYDAALMAAALILLLIVLGFNLLATLALRQITGRMA